MRHLGAVGARTALTVIHGREARDYHLPQIALIPSAAARITISVVETGMHPDLERLFAFYAQQRGSPPDAFSHAPRLVPSPSFFSVKILQNHLNNPLLTSDWIALVAGGQFVPLEPAGLQKVVQNKPLFFMDKEVIEQQLGRGAALLLEGLDILDPSINAFATKLDAALPCALTNCVAFFSQRGNEAYKGHQDLDDVLVIHLEGEKRWHLFERRQRKLSNKGGLSKEQMGKPLSEVVMQPGDALYLRAGTPHICQTTGACSLHISFDLRDQTPSVSEISKEANARFANAAAEQYAPASTVIEKYVDVLKSDQFLRDVAQATTKVRNDALYFRRRIGRTSGISALSKYTRGK